MLLDMLGILGMLLGILSDWLLSTADTVNNFYNFYDNFYVFYFLAFVLLTAFITVWVFLDSRRRMNHSVGWTLSTFFFGLTSLAVYLSKRNLKQGEVRSSGTGWNVSRNLAVGWTILCAMRSCGILFLSDSYSLSDTGYGAEYFTAAMQLGGVVMLFVFWLAGIFVLIVLGLFLRDANVVEEGPTGALADGGGLAHSAPTRRRKLRIPDR